MKSIVEEAALMVGAQKCLPSWVITAFLLELWAQGQGGGHWLDVFLSAILNSLARFISKT